MRFVVWIWKGTREYVPEHVNHLYRQLSRVCPGRFSLVCVTDELRGFDAGVEVIPTPPAALALSELRSPEKPNFPSCYRRLWMFSEDAKALGERVMLIDVDLVFTADPAPLFSRTEDFVGWRPLRTWGRESRFGGGVYLLRTGTRTHVWTDFKGAQSINLARMSGLRGSDQAWLSYCLSGKEPSWPQNCGIYSVRDLTYGPVTQPARQTVRRHSPALPADAIIVQFNGPNKSWSTSVWQTMPWVKEHYEGRTTA